MLCSNVPLLNSLSAKKKRRGKKRKKKKYIVEIVLESKNGRIHLQRRRLQPSLRNQQLIQNTAKWLVKQLLH